MEEKLGGDEKTLEAEIKEKEDGTNASREVDDKTEQSQIKQGEEVNLEVQLTDINQEITLEDGTVTTIAKVAAKLKEDPECVLEKYNEADGKTFDEKLKNTVEDIEGEQIGAPRLEHNHNQ